MKIIKGTKQKIIRELYQLPDDNTIYKLKKAVKKRTLSQNSYLHVIFELVTKEINIQQGVDAFEMEDIKIMFKEMFLEVKHKKIGPEYIKILARTRDLDTKQLNAFIEQIKDWSLNMLNMTIPDPGDKRLLEWVDDNF